MQLFKIVLSWSLFILFAVAFGSLFITNIDRIPDAQFIHILGYFRHPHHDVPSTFPFNDYLKAVAFIWVSIQAWFWLGDNKFSSKYSSLSLVVLTCILILLCVLGFFFVELMPTRFGVLFRPFRLLLLIKWLGLILCAGLVSRLYANESTNNHVSSGFVLGVSMVSPVSMFFGFAIVAAREFGKKHLPSLGVGFITTTLLFCMLILVFYSSPARLSLYSLIVYLLVISVLRLQRMGKWPIRGIITLVIVGFGGLAFAGCFSKKPNLTLSDLSSNQVEIATWAKENTQINCSFLTPPDFGIFRLVSGRAIIVDFKAFPFQDVAMLKWYDRLKDCYGDSNYLGFAAASQMDENYRNITVNKLEKITEKYKVSYAILYSQTQIDLPVLVETNEYKVVSLRTSD